MMATKNLEAFLDPVVGVPYLVPFDYHFKTPESKARR